MQDIMKLCDIVRETGYAAHRYLRNGHVEKVYEIPEMGRAAKGRSIANLLELRADEKIAATIRVQAILRRFAACQRSRCSARSCPSGSRRCTRQPSGSKGGFVPIAGRTANQGGLLLRPPGGVGATACT